MKPYNPKNQSPLLAGMTGTFSFEDRLLHLKATPLGNLIMPKGMLTVVDPFADMTRGGNLGIFLPPQSKNSAQYAVWVTQAHAVSTTDMSDMSHGNEGDVSKGQISQDDLDPDNLDNSVKELPRNAYLTLVIQPEVWSARQQWVSKHQQNDLECNIPKEALRFLHLTSDGHPPAGLADLYEDEFVGVAVSSGTCAFVDDTTLVEGMPPDVPGNGWADSVFDHGLTHSWFDAMDAETPLPIGMANLPLPLFNQKSSNQPNIILCESGYGDGYYPVIGEYAFDYKNQEKTYPVPLLIAIHVDFKVVPFSDTSPVAQNKGPR